MEQVKSPQHYKIVREIEAKDIIEASLDTLADKANLTPYECYCLGCFLKYRLRAGKKDDIAKDIAKSEEYLKFITEDIEDKEDV